MSSIVNNTKEDIIYFKDEVLKDVKKFEVRVNQKVDYQETTIKKKLDEYDIKMEAMTQKVNELENKISTNISLIKKVEEIYNFKVKAEQDTLVQEIRFDTIEKDLRNAINKYDSILLESVIYAGVIGKGAKFEKFHDLIDYLLNNVSNLNLAKEKNVVDLKGIKKKYDAVVELLKSQINSNSRNIKEVNKKLTEYMEDQFKLMREDISGKFVDLRMTNNKHAIELKERSDKLSEIYKSMEILRNDMEQKFKKEIDRIINIPPEVNRKLLNFHNEIEAINYQFMELSEFVKNYKFEAKIVKRENKEESNDIEEEDTKDNKITAGTERRQMKRNIKNEKFKLSKEPISILKQYINGEITFEEYNRKRKMQFHGKEEAKVEENKINKNDEFDSKIAKKVKVMGLASEAEIVVINKNKNVDFILKEDNEQNNKQELKLSDINPKITQIKKKVKVKENEKELTNNKNANNDINKMIKMYNINHNKFKKSIETSNKANNTSFQEFESLSYKMDDLADKEYSYNKINSANSSPNREKEKEFNEEEKSKSIDKKNNSDSLYLEEKKLFPDVNFFGSGSIEVINYNQRKTKDIKDKKMDILEYIRKSYDEQEVNDEKKLFQLNKAINFNNSLKQINNMNRSNYSNFNNDVFNNTLSNPYKKNIMKKLVNKKIYRKNNAMSSKNINENQSLSIGFLNEKRSEPSNIISLEKINFDNNKRKINIDSVKNNSKILNPIKLKGSKSCNNIIQKKQNENDITNLEENKIGKLVNKIKVMIPYEDKISVFETSNIDNLNKNVFSKKKIYYEKKEENYELKSLPIKKLNAIYQHEPRMRNNNRQMNLLNNEN